MIRAMVIAETRSREENDFARNLRRAFRSQGTAAQRPPAVSERTRVTNASRASCSEIKNVQDRDDVALLIATGKGSFELALAALMHGANPNRLMSYEKVSAFHVAAQEGHTDILRLFLHHGAAVGLPDGRGRSALHNAAATGSIDNVKLLIENNADVQARGDMEDTPLAAAVAEDRVEVVQYLLDHGAKTEQVFDGISALWLAVVEKSPKSLRAMIDMGANVNELNSVGIKPLHDAAVHGNAEVIKILLEAGADINEKCRAGNHTPLEFAANSAQEFPRSAYDRVKTLLDHGATFDGWDSTKFGRACHNAIVIKDKKLVELYLDNGCDPSWHTIPPLLTLLGVAALAGDTEIGKLLLDRGADMEAEPRPLYAALFSSCTEFVDLLLKRGACCSVCEQDGRNCMQIAAVGTEVDDSVRKELIEVLVKNGVSTETVNRTFHNTVLHEAAESGKDDAVQALVELGANVNAKNMSGMTPLMLACCNNRLSTAQILVDSGKADIACKAHDGSHALFGAVEQGFKDMVKYLLAKGAPPDLAGNNDIRPLEIAVTKSNIALAHMLLEAGSDPNRVTSGGNSLLQLAASDGDSQMLRLLLDHGAKPLVHDSNSVTVLGVAAEDGLAESGESLDECVHSQKHKDLGNAGQSDLQAVQQKVRCAKRSETDTRLAAVTEKLCLCPITHEIMQDPVVAPDGHSYERSAITTWLSLHERSPLTQESMTAEQLIPNWNLKQQIAAFRKNCS